MWVNSSLTTVSISTYSCRDSKNREKVTRRKAKSRKLFNLHHKLRRRQLALQLLTSKRITTQRRDQLSQNDHPEWYNTRGKNYLVYCLLDCWRQYKNQKRNKNRVKKKLKCNCQCQRCQREGELLHHVATWSILILLLFMLLAPVLKRI